VLILTRYSAVIMINLKDINTIKDMRLAMVDGGADYTPAVPLS